MIGEAHPRLGGDRFVAGSGRFVDDVRVPGLLHAAVLRSPHAHARLVSIDAKRARHLPGVRLVLTAADVPESAIIPNRVPAPAGTNRYLQPAIARTVVRFVGEPVALVVADDPYTAHDALELLDAAYAPLPALKLGRPVKWVESRRENLMAANHAREVTYEAEIGFDREGRIVGLRAI